MAKIACIDIGTVTVRLGIFSTDTTPIVFEQRRSTICDLGKGFTDTGSLMPEAIARVLRCIDDYLVIMKDAQVEYATCILTAAARESSNVEPLISGLEQRGLIGQVIGGKTEGSLTFFGVCQDFMDDRILAVDNGGGSTELAVGRYTFDEEAGYRTQPVVTTNACHRVPMVERIMSLSIGCRRVSDRFGIYTDTTAAGAPKPECVQRAREYAHKQFSYAVDEEGILWLEPKHVIACGGTPTSLVAMKKQLVPYDPAQVHLHELTLDDIEELICRMSTMSLAELETWPGLQSKRASVIFSGAIILAELIRSMKFNSIIVSEHDLLTGLALCAAADYRNDFIPLPWKPGLAPLHL